MASTAFLSCSCLLFFAMSDPRRVVLRRPCSSSPSGHHRQSRVPRIASAPPNSFSPSTNLGNTVRLLNLHHQLLRHPAPHAGTHSTSSNVIPPLDLGPAVPRGPLRSPGGPGHLVVRRHSLSSSASVSTPEDRSTRHPRPGNPVPGVPTHLPHRSSVNLTALPHLRSPPPPYAEVLPSGQSITRPAKKPRWRHYGYNPHTKTWPTALSADAPPANPTPLALQHHRMPQPIPPGRLPTVIHPHCLRQHSQHLLCTPSTTCPLHCLSHNHGSPPHLSLCSSMTSMAVCILSPFRPTSPGLP